MANPETLVESTTVTGSVAVGSSGNVTLISSGTNQIYVYAYSLSAPSTVANGGHTVRMMSGSTTECWRVTVAGASSAVAGVAALAVTPPAYLFRTVAGDALTYEKGSTVQGALTHFSFGFWRQ